jgi:hypothetical protein
MPGRGRVPETLSPDFIAALKHRYVETDQPVREIIAEFEISLGRLNRLIEKEGWPKRQDRPPRALPAAVKLREEARMLATPPPRSGGEGRLASPHASRGGGPADTEAPPTPDPSPPRASRAWGGEPTECAAPPDSPATETDPAARIEQLVLKELAAEEAVRARLRHAPRPAADAERSARTLAILTQTLQNLQRLRAGQDSFGPPDDDDDDMPADLDEFRYELARRIDAFVASRTDERDAEPGGAADDVAAAR